MELKDVVNTSKKSYEEDRYLDVTELSKKDKKIIEEIVELIQNRQGVPTPMLISEIKTKYQLEDIPEEKLEGSLFFKFTRDMNNLGINQQGFNLYKENNKLIKVPFYAFSADLRELNNFIMKLTEKVLKNLK